MSTENPRSDHQCLTLSSSVSLVFLTHNPEVVGSNPAPATKTSVPDLQNGQGFSIAGGLLPLAHNWGQSLLACPFRQLGTVPNCSFGPPKPGRGQVLGPVRLGSACGWRLRLPLFSNIRRFRQFQPSRCHFFRIADELSGAPGSRGYDDSQACSSAICPFPESAALRAEIVGKSKKVARKVGPRMRAG